MEQLSNIKTGSWCQIGSGPLSRASSNLRATDTPPPAPSPTLHGRNWTLSAADVRRCAGWCCPPAAVGHGSRFPSWKPRQTLRMEKLQPQTKGEDRWPGSGRLRALALSPRTRARRLPTGPRPRRPRPPGSSRESQPDLSSPSAGSQSLASL